MHINTFSQFPKPDNVTHYICDRYVHYLNEVLHWWITITVLYNYQVPTLVLHTCNILKFNVPSCAIQTKQPYFYTPIVATRFDSCTEHALKTALPDTIDR